MPSVGDSSVLLWVASACIALLGARTFFEYLRRVRFEGPLRMWRELLLGSLALTAALWSAMVIDIGAQGLVFAVGYHPGKVFGTFLLGTAAMAGVVTLATLRPVWWHRLVAAMIAALVALVVQVGVIWSVGAEPGLTWRAESLVFALLLHGVGMAFAGHLVTSARRGSHADRPSRRLLAALVLGACAVAAQELAIASSGLDHQVVSAHARFLPEVIVTLVAGAGVPVALVLMLVDQRTQQHSRASVRARRLRVRAEGASEPGITESLFVEAESKSPPAH
ncbi:MAG: hypothetical protein ABS84_07620 [Rubrivivax sp. SCN 71-131]|jgi:hypothetical protein|nr:MAG: hypothetical protein ABS84_07620 [Rubrivivax sp. SCN 71-131]